MFTTYTVRTTHRAIKIAAPDHDSAVNSVMLAEHCPRSAIVEVVREPVGMFAVDLQGAIVYLPILARKDCPLWHHNAGLQQTTSGYGNRLTSRKMVRTEEKGPWRRVYARCFSNSCTAYVTIKGRNYCIAD